MRPMSPPGEVFLCLSPLGTVKERAPVGIYEFF